MARVDLHDPFDPTTEVKLGNIKLDSDAGDAMPGQTPTAVLLKRVQTGRDQDGNRVFDWVEFDSVEIVEMDQRTVIEDEQTLIQFTATFLHPNEFLEPAGGVAVRMLSDLGVEELFRITEYRQDSIRLIVEGEKVQG